MISALDIHVTGIVQGVGFRPFVYRLARSHIINGWVLNSADGVHIHAEGEDDNLDSFCLAIANEAPAAASVAQVDMKEVPLEQFSDFEIRFSKDENMASNSDGQSTLVSADLATCSDCVRELFDPSDRRYRYPFINCTNCGPRFTIIDELPYDRDKTSMKKFEMCPDCEHEYKDPLDRRFHAQPDACFECGPQITWSEDNGQTVSYGDCLENSDNIFRRAVEMLKQGKIIAIKGLGGFHLACDACNEQAVVQLRSRKQRSNKAFAIMAANTQSASKIVEVSNAEKDVLEGVEAPIVLLRKKECCESIISSEVTKGLGEIGVMLPYTPVQHILMHDFCEAGGQYLVMTSGNVYDNPIVTDDTDAFKILGNIADAFLGNNREILTRYDDSVVRVLAVGTDTLNSDNNKVKSFSAIQMIRRARGFAPVPIKLKIGNDNFVQHPIKNTLAVGTEQKNTCCFMRNSIDKSEVEIFISQHIGDLENSEIMNAWHSAKDRLQNLFDVEPEVIVHDAHPEYLSTQWATSQDLKQNKSRKSVQHHFAHIASVMAENNLQGPVAGFSFDGTGLGTDNYIWGGEVLICNNKDYERFANFCYSPMPGVEACIKNPLQMAFGLIYTYDLLEHQAVKNLYKKEQFDNLLNIVESGINTTYTSSLGRIFDAISAVIGICSNPTYEGEPAILLEAEMYKNNSLENLRYNPDSRYKILFTKSTAMKNSTAHDTSVLLMDAHEMLKAVLDDFESDVSKDIISHKVHDAIIEAIVTCSMLIEQLYGIKQIALSGGCFMNRYFMQNSIEQLMRQGFTVAINREVPCNDGGVSLGQAVIGANQ